MKFQKLIASISIVALSFIGCQENNTSTGSTNKETMEFTHKLGTTKVTVKPERVVVLDIGAVETFDELGLKFVGLPKNSLPPYLEKYKNDKSIENVGTVKEINFEKIHALNPDLIIISTRLETSYDELSKIAPTLFYDIDPLNYISTFEANTRMVGKLYGLEDDVEEKLQEIRYKIDEVKNGLENFDEKGLVVLFNNGNFSAFGQESRFGFVHKVMGIAPIIDDLEVSSHGQKISNEFILNADPDYLFVIDRNAVVTRNPSKKEDIENKLIKETQAYKNNKIVYLDPFVWYLSQGGLTSTRKMVDEIEKGVAQNKD